jgi:UDPglucose 6-dehydrogenase
VLGDRIKARFGASLAGKRIAVWGLAFKPETDDIREAPALTLVKDLVAAGATVVGYDPAAMEHVRGLGLPLELATDMYAAAQGANALALVTEWKQFRAADFKRLRATMAEPILFDGRNIWDPEQLREFDFEYTAIGRCSQMRASSGSAPSALGRPKQQ